MTGHRRFIHALIVPLVMLLGLAMVTPAGAAAQDDIDGTPATIATQDDGTDPDGGADQDRSDEDPPGCDDHGWRVVTTEDGDGFASEDHCDDHVAEHGDDSLVTVSSAEANPYIYITVAPPVDAQCAINLTLVNPGQQNVRGIITLSNGWVAQPLFEPGAGKLSFDSAIDEGITIVSGTASSEPGGTPVPVLIPQPTCGASGR